MFVLGKPKRYGDSVEPFLNVDAVPASHVMPESNKETMANLFCVDYVFDHFAVASLFVKIVVAECWIFAA